MDIDALRLHLVNSSLSTDNHALRAIAEMYHLPIVQKLVKEVHELGERSAYYYDLYANGHPEGDDD
jgi:hypothetical protein